MKFFPILAALALAGGAHAAVVFTSGTLNVAIPDDTDTGLARTLSVPDGTLSGAVSVTLNLSVPAGQTGWFGDLYGYVQHASGLSVLLSRPGRTAGNPAGYADGMNVALTFSDSAANGDIHAYRTQLSGNESTPVTSLLTGAWQPDGRTTDPALTLGVDARTASLDQFTGANPAGDWTLFLADLSGGGTYQLDSWSINFAPVPEPAEMASIAGGCLGGWLLLRRNLKRRAGLSR